MSKLFIAQNRSIQSSEGIYWRYIYDISEETEYCTFFSITSTFYDVDGNIVRTLTEEGLNSTEYRYTNPGLMQIPCAKVVIEVRPDKSVSGVISCEFMDETNNTRVGSGWVDYETVDSFGTYKITFTYEFEFPITVTYGIISIRH